MSASGRDKWWKYFANREVETVMWDTGSFNPDNGGSAFKIKKGEPITVLKTVDYDSQQRIKYKKTDGKYVEGTVSIADITKPGVAPGKQKGVFKPQTFGITGQPMKIDPYAKAVLKHIKDSDMIGGGLEVYLTALVNYYVGSPKTTAAELKKLWSNDFPVNDINNDFGEIMGPIVMIKTTLGKAKDLNFNTSSIINIPTAPNEPLMDFALINNGKPPYSFSSKSLSTAQTNTVKCQDIIKLLCEPDKITGQKSAICKKYEGTLQYKLLEILCEHSMVQGGYAIGNHLLSAAPEFKAEFEGLENYHAIGQLKGDPTKLPSKPGENQGFMEKHFSVYMDKNKIPENERTPIGVLYSIEKKIAKLTKTNHKLKFNDLFAAAVQSKLVYIKFQVNKSNGLPEWKLETSPDFKVSGKIHLRSKTTKNRLTDKIGVQT